MRRTPLASRTHSEGYLTIPGMGLRYRDSTGNIFRFKPGSPHAVAHEQYKRNTKLVYRDGPSPIVGFTMPAGTKPPSILRTDPRTGRTPAPAPAPRPAAGNSAPAPGPVAQAAPGSSYTPMPTGGRAENRRAEMNRMVQQAGASPDTWAPGTREVAGAAGGAMADVRSANQSMGRPALWGDPLPDSDPGQEAYWNRADMRQWAGSNFELANRLRERKGLAALQKDASGNILWGQGNTTSPYAGAFSQQLPVDLATAFSPEASQALRGVAANPVSVPPESLQRAWNQPSDLNGFTGPKIDFQYTPMTPAAPGQDYGRYFRSSPADLATSFSPQASQALQGVVQGQTPVPPESLQKAWNQPTPGLEAFSGAAQLPADYLRRFRLQGR